MQPDFALRQEGNGGTVVQVLLYLWHSPAQRTSCFYFELPARNRYFKGTAKCSKRIDGKIPSGNEFHCPVCLWQPGKQPGRDQPLLPGSQPEPERKIFERHSSSMPRNRNGDDSTFLLSFQHAMVLALLECSPEEISKKLQIFSTYLQSKAYPIEKMQYTSILYLGGIWNELTAKSCSVPTGIIISAAKNILQAADCDALFESIAQALEKLYQEVNNTEALKSPEESRYITQVIQFINEHYKENISIADIASCVHLNPRYLGKLFKDATNYTLTEYLNRTRIRHSKELLSTGKYTIQKISELSGYADIRAYIRFFKKFEGCTPGEFCKTQNK